MKLNDIFVYPKYPESLNKLFELTKNLWCLWDGNARHIFYRIAVSYTHLRAHET